MKLWQSLLAVTVKLSPRLVPVTARAQLSALQPPVAEMEAASHGDSQIRAVPSNLIVRAPGLIVFRMLDKERSSRRLSRWPCSFSMSKGLLSHLSLYICPQLKPSAELRLRILPLELRSKSSTVGQGCNILEILPWHRWSRLPCVPVLGIPLETWPNMHRGRGPGLARFPASTW